MNTKFNFTVDVLKTRLDKFLSEQSFDEKIISRSKIQKDIEAGLVLVNKEVQVLPKFVVRENDHIQYQPSKEPDSNLPVNLPLHTLYNNHDLLILDKPAGLAVHPGAGLKGDSLSQALLFHFKDIYLVGEEGRNGIVHRLDKDTSGVIAIALSSEMYLHLKNAFATRKVKKEYIAIVCGHVSKSHGFIEAPLGKSKKDFRKYTVNKSDMLLEKDALTEYEVIEHLQLPQKIGGVKSSLDEYTIIKVKLHTGRTHQIRVHMNSIGYPLVGDKLYGGKRTQKLGFPRQALHSKKIGLELPNKEWVEVESQLPDDLKELLKKLNSKNINRL